MLYKFIMSDNTIVYVKEDEFQEIKQVMDYLNIKCEITVVEEKMYCIHWFDFIDDEWAIIWSTKDEINSYMNDILEAKVEYYIEEFN